ncbi:MAG: PilZ domain-containing protein, partial [Sandaracinaceae bacterium]|nr:PilZ domain-containing protein [Sandaracinaceae bacterium]
MIENRAEKRADIETQVRIRSHSVADFIAEHSRDLSVGGVFVATNEPMAKHTLVKLEIGTDEEEPIRAVGRIIWTRTPEQASESAPAGMGIKFVKIGDDERARIAALVEKAGEGAGSRAPREDEEESPPEEASEPEEPVAEPTEARAK